MDCAKTISGGSVDRSLSRNLSQVCFINLISLGMGTDLLQKPLLVLDGGLGTSLEDEHGIRFSSEATPLWSSDLLVSDPSVLAKLQQNFVRAGADILLTATYQSSFHGFANTRTKHHTNGVQRNDAEQYMLSAVHIARSAFSDIGNYGLVALSLGAFGACCIPGAEYSGEYGNIAFAGLQEFHRDRVSVFLNHAEWLQIDLLAFETLPRIDEVKAVRQVMQDLLEEKPYWITCVFPKPDSDDLPDGSTVKQVVSAMLQGEKPPFAIGLNCTKVSKVPNLIQKFETAIDELGFDPPRLVIYPDGAGDQVYNTTKQVWETDDHLTNSVSQWDESMLTIVQEAQVRGKWKGIIVGGCCKTRPAHIAALRKRIDAA